MDSPNVEIFQHEVLLIILFLHNFWLTDFPFGLWYRSADPQLRDPHHGQRMRHRLHGLRMPFGHDFLLQTHKQLFSLPLQVLFFPMSVCRKEFCEEDVDSACKAKALAVRSTWHTHRLVPEKGGHGSSPSSARGTGTDQEVPWEAHRAEFISGPLQDPESFKHWQREAKRQKQEAFEEGLGCHAYQHLQPALRNAL